MKTETEVGTVTLEELVGDAPVEEPTHIYPVAPGTPGPVTSFCGQSTMDGRDLVDVGSASGRGRYCGACLSAYQRVRGFSFFERLRILRMLQQHVDPKPDAPRSWLDRLGDLKRAVEREIDRRGKRSDEA